MDVVIPKEITSTVLTSNIEFPKSDEIEWTVGAYSTGDVRYVGTTKYESLKDNNTDNPVDGERLTPPSWLNIGGVERYRMFDDRNETVTTGDLTIDSGRIEVTFTYSALKDVLALFNTTATNVTVVVDSVRGGGAGIYASSISGIDRTEINGWWSFYKARRSQRKTFLFDDLPTFTDSVVHVTIENGSSAAICGNLVIGQMYDLGETLSGMSPRIKNISRYVTDAFERRTYISRGSVRELDVTVKFPTYKHDAIQRVMEGLVGKPTAWIGTNKFTTSVIWGEGEYTPEISNHPISDASYQIEAAL